jgi:hypothetical protein
MNSHTTESGYFFRPAKNNKTEITYLVHLDGKGNLSLLPESVTRKMLILNQYNLIAAVHAAIEEKKTLATMGKLGRSGTISADFIDVDDLLEEFHEDNN